MKMKIAVDTTISIKTQDALEKTGFEVVCAAREGEADEEWIQRAIKMEADIVISSDLDIPNLLDRYEYPAIWIDLPQGKINQYNYIVQSIKRMERVYREKV
jgi:predicted nuclease of predicted toxin-antitoxin system